jgi:ABC-type nitrate/sulfonate/bicarbonate transport system substrate-binding protein
MSPFRVVQALCLSLVAAAAADFAVPFSLPPAAAEEPVRIAMNFTWQTTYLPLRYAMAKGYFKAVDVAPEILPMQGDDQSLQMLETGKVDYAFMSDVVFLTNAMKNNAQDTAIYVWLDQQTFHLASHAPLAGPSAMLGKSFATTVFSPGRYELQYVLRRNGIDPAGVQIQTTDFSVLYATFMSGGFDTVEVHSPGSWQNLLVAANAQNKRLYLTRLADWGFTGYSKILVVRNSLLAERAIR